MMSEYILWVFLLALGNVFLFFAKDFGINVILFMVPFISFLYYVLKKNNKINNKKGLLYIIPIILLSVTYLLFNNYMFQALNFLAIIVLVELFLVITNKSDYNLINLIKRIISNMLLPLTYVDRLYRVTINKISCRFKMNDKVTKVLKVLVIVLPIVLVVIALLSSADMVFENVFGSFFDDLFEFLEIYFFDNLFGRIFLFIFIYFLIGTCIMYILFNNEKKIENKNNNKSRDLLTTKVLLSSLNVIYVIFDFIQIKSLMLHSVSSNINYAQYARQGFFELLFVSLINLTIILVSRKFENKNNTKEFKYIKIMDVIMVFLTIIIIASSFMRMHMYEMEFGYTVLRLLVFAALISETILMIPTIMYIFNEKIDIVRSYVIILLIVYTGLNFINIDYVIANRNINRYYDKHNIDIDYLMNYEYDNIPLLVDFYNRVEDEKIKTNLNDYLVEMKRSINDRETSILEYNLSYYKAKKVLNKTNLKEDSSIYE